MGKLDGTDLSDTAWALVEPCLPAAKPSGRPRRTSLRAVVDAVFISCASTANGACFPATSRPGARSSTTS